VLIKLAEPIGAYSHWQSGGLRCGWVKFPYEAVPAGLVPDDRIVIPHHPKDEIQQFDFDRNKITDSSETLSQ
jgi:hypothetical protein